MTGYTLIMKTAISIPDELFREVEACSRRLKLSRSRLFATAVREYLARQGGSSSTDAWNEAIAAAGQPGEEAAALAVRTRSKLLIKATLLKRP
jgi:metal-responsive CopG/Arc/MetJ family transcriptional regulator